MRWLRERPVAWEELDSVDFKGRWVGTGPGAGKEEEDVKMERGRLFDEDDELKEDGDEEEEEEEDDDKMKVEAPVPEQRRAPPVPPTRGGKAGAPSGGKGKAGGSR